MSEQQKKPFLEHLDLSFMRPSAIRIPDLPPVTPLSHWLSGDAGFKALVEAVERIKTAAPPDHDVLVSAFGISVTAVRYLEPHTLLFSGFDASGNQTAVVAHFSQLVAHVITLPKRGPERVVTGFWRDET